MTQDMKMQRLIALIDGWREEVITLQRHLVAIPALAPENEGDGERVKADYMRTWLEELGLDELKEINAPDARVSCGHRPNLLGWLYGEERGRTVWVLAHLDVVPPGDAEQWAPEDPYTLRVKGDLLLGRGVEDNHQGLISGLLAVKAFKEAGIKPRCNLGLALVADEETSSRYGLDYLMTHHRDQFGGDDLVLVPDAGDPEGKIIEIAEKSILWLKVTVIGAQCHASTPGEGNNAARAAAHLVVRMDALEGSFAARDELFDPPISTFEPTKHESNVPNVNTIPGKDVFYFDCRVLPQYPLAEVEKKIRALADEVEQRFGVTVRLEPQQRAEAAPPTPEDAPVVIGLKQAIRAIKGVEPRCVGIGGGTVAAIFRRAGIPAAVWSTLEDTAHQPGETSRISHTLSDARVMAHLMLHA
ncbi:MAG TPA: M20 family metallo-hydrolase [bacterium]|nr:M20 family metallo-hydrolase [bacterium]HPR86454.1 M20 family metallo-hydrolase [bacterium]